MAGIPTTAGWFKVHRKLMESPMWRNSSPAHKAVVMTILASAMFEEHDWWDSDSGECVRLKPGQFTTSNRALAANADVSVSAVKHALTRLVAQGFIHRTARHRYSLITVCNWTYYQGENAHGPATHEPTTHEATREATHEATHEATREATRKEEVRSKNEETTPLTPHEPEPGAVPFPTAVVALLQATDNGTAKAFRAQCTAATAEHGPVPVLRALAELDGQLQAGTQLRSPSAYIRPILARHAAAYKRETAEARESDRRREEDARKLAEAQGRKGTPIDLTSELQRRVADQEGTTP